MMRPAPLARPMTRSLPLVAGVAALAAAWSGLPAMMFGHGFSAHMTAHLTVVCVAAPLIALALAGARLDPVRVAPVLFAAIPASLFELAVVWGWHAPALHDAARQASAMLVLEQASFLLAGLVLWLSVLSGPGGDGVAARNRTAAGVIALLLTSMHMTLLGTLLALAPRPLYGESHGLAAGVGLADQQLGGTLMLIVGGATYLAGGLALAARLLRAEPERVHAAAKAGAP